MPLPLPPLQPQDSLMHQGRCQLLGLLVSLQPRQQSLLLVLTALVATSGPQQLLALQQMLRSPPGAQVLPSQQPGMTLVPRQQLCCSQQLPPHSQPARDAAGSAPGTPESARQRQQRWRQQLPQLYPLLPLQLVPPQTRLERWRKRSRALPQRLPLPPQALPLCSCLSRIPSGWRAGGP
jgi:hypothetical protein